MSSVRLVLWHKILSDLKIASICCSLKYTQSLNMHIFNCWTQHVTGILCLLQQRVNSINTLIGVFSCFLKSVFCGLYCSYLPGYTTVAYVLQCLFTNLSLFPLSPTGTDVKEAQVICVSTGTKCINGEYMSDRGLALNDCHAEIIARRSLIRYLYTQLEFFLRSVDGVTLFHQTQISVVKFLVLIIQLHVFTLLFALSNSVLS